VAAVVLIGAAAAVYFARPSPAAAAQGELLAIYRHNLSAHGDFVTEADPARLAGHLRSRLGYTPALPRLAAGMSLRGCCVRRFRGKPAASYVVDTPAGAVSIVATTIGPESLGLTKAVCRNGCDCIAGECMEGCNLAATRRGRYFYYAVGEVPAERLTEVLGRLAGEQG
jgi:hypothetical protein